MEARQIQIGSKNATSVDRYKSESGLAVGGKGLYGFGIGIAILYFLKRGKNA